jgi:dihydrodipicolinate reductase
VRFLFRLLTRIVLFIIGTTAAYVELLQAIDAVTSDWAHPIMGCIFCGSLSVGVVMFTFWAMVDPLNEKMKE